MDGTGPAKPSLSERLREKASAERSAIEASTLDALRQHGESMNAVLSSAVASIESDMEQRLSRLQSKLDASERRQRLMPLWSALASIGIVLFGLLSMWATSEWLRWNMDRSRTELGRVQLRIGDERRALEALRRETGEVRIQRYADGSTFVELPAGTDTRTIYRCREEKVPCVKLPN